MKERAILIGRFQVPEMNVAYRKLIESIKEKHGDVILVLAVPGIPVSMVNPLPLQSRITMIEEAFRGLKILSLKDHPLDEAWSRNLDELLNEKISGDRFVIYGTRERFINQYRGKHKTAELPDEETERPSVEEEPSSIAFRKGMVHASGKRYPAVFPTVDVAVFRNNRSQILLGKKDADGKWRLIGGFADPTDEGFTAAAKRELHEECGEIETSELVYEGSFKIDDWRYRFEQDKIISTLFSTDYISGEIQAQDDVAELDWFPIAELPNLIKEDKTAREHAQMFRDLLKKYHKER